MRKKWLRLAWILILLMAATVTLAVIYTIYLMVVTEETPIALWTAVLLILIFLAASSLIFNYLALSTISRPLKHKHITENENRLTTVLDNLISAVVMIGDRQQIVLLNKMAEEMLGIRAKDYLDKHYSKMIHHETLQDLMQDCIGKKEIMRNELVIDYPVKRILDVNMIPITKDDQLWSGMIIVLHDISEIRRLETIRSEFVANVSHELKTPVAAVKGFAETLMSGAVNDPETTQSFLRIIYDESDRLNRLILDILELSKIESKQVQLSYSPIELSHFIKKAISMMKSEAEKKNIQLSMNVPEGVYIEADEDRLQQVILNLVANSVSYTGEGGKVEVSVVLLDKKEEGETEKVQIIVSDNGIGIPEKDLPRIFERFYRVDKARSRGSGGTGLGLSIVKHIVDLHQGKIKVESKLNEGSRFIIELPIIQCI